MNNVQSRLGAAVISTLSRSLIVVGELRSRLERFPERASDEQRRAIGTDVAFFILTTAGPSATRLLHEVDEATEGALHVAPRSDSIPILTSDSVVEARARAASLALRLGFSAMERTRIATAVSELARNVQLYAGKGQIDLHVLGSPSNGLQIVARDEGPGIHDVNAVLSEGFRSERGLGLGLKGVRRVANEFDIKSTPGKGTTVLARFLLPRR